MTRLIAQLVCGNEARRYLRPCLEWLATIVDDIHVYDDRSEDDSLLISRGYGTVTVRDERRPSFTDNEGGFRQDAWWAMERALKPADGDWVFTVDTDEFPVALAGVFTERGCLDYELDRAGDRTVQFNIPEIFRRDDDGLHYRTDGYWPTITGRRLAPWRPAGQFDLIERGGGSLPSYTYGAPWHAETAAILHLGYARPEDRVEKYNRYRDPDGVHSNDHVGSILGHPVLHRWEGAVPDVL